MPDRPLVLVGEAKVRDLVGGPAGAAFEASGVVAVGDSCYVVFDNSPHIGRVAADLSPGDRRNRLIPQRRRGGYEDIAQDPVSGHFFLLVEALPRKHGFMAKVREYNQRFDYVSSGWMEFRLDRANKGLEGLTCLRRDDQLFLLGLCEGNRCRAGVAGRRPGGGRIQVFARSGGRTWEHVDRIRLPASLGFEDYSSLAVLGKRLCVVSQTASAAWFGRLAPSAWAVADDGCVYRFPHDERGRTVYCNIEGVSWIEKNRLVVVSDRMKSGSQKRRCAAKDQSIHVFTIPAGNGR
jgi:hypothetical protein